MSKQEIISNVYYDRAGYGSRQRTSKEAREKDKSINIDDVNEFFKKNVEAKRKPAGQNNFVAPHSAYEYQMNLFFLYKRSGRSKVQGWYDHDRCL